VPGAGRWLEDRQWERAQPPPRIGGAAAGSGSARRGADVGVRARRRPQVREEETGMSGTVRGWLPSAGRFRNVVARRFKREPCTQGFPVRGGQ